MTNEARMTNDERAEAALLRHSALVIRLVFGFVHSSFLTTCPASRHGRARKGGNLWTTWTMISRN
jgi:hypothetical protein